MITLIDSTNRHRYLDLLDQMFQLRAEVFKNRLGWDVTVHDNKEIDVFDAADPLYLLSLNEQTGELQGSVRLLPTTGPNMLRDVFHALLPDGEVVEDPLIWESTRFCIDPKLPLPSGGGLHHVTGELLCGLVEAGMKIGLRQIVSVYDARMVRIFRAANCPAQLIGRPYRFGEVMTYAGLFDVSPTMRDRIGAKANIGSDPVIGSISGSLAA
jgi:acyl homoserine lactone synthase